MYLRRLDGRIFDAVLSLFPILCNKGTLFLKEKIREKHHHGAERILPRCALGI